MANKKLGTKLDDTLQVRLEKDLKDKLAAKAKEIDRSLSYTAVVLLREALAQS